MFMFLYLLPTLDRYKVRSGGEYYAAECVRRQLPTYGSEKAAQYCNWMQFCGFPMGGEFRDTGECALISGRARPSTPREENGLGVC